MTAGRSQLAPMCAQNTLANARAKSESHLQAHTWRDTDLQVYALVSCDTVHMPTPYASHALCQASPATHTR
eukprot:5616032-Alexandrium_andersonii.AAC.1